ncbi:hypothetical protein WSM22_36360 [Cytophagales bacterium WSM2-2]|nr:hypothetical protein WSM22_36360 [Cytophagales bacterium WSM2-2]
MKNERIIDEIRKFLAPDCQIPEGIGNPINDNEVSCWYLADCAENKYLWLSNSFRKTTGYESGDLKLAIEWWISCVHPEDLERVYEMISLFKHTELLSYFFLEYRFKRKDGEWIWVKEHKHILSWNNGKVDKILCKIVDITSEKLKTDYPTMPAQNRFRLADVLEKQLNFRKKQLKSRKQAVSFLTKREKEILLLISQGCSTKEISDRLYVSINTIETHRTHLLQKLQAKNSIELIAKSSEVICLV